MSGVEAAATLLGVISAVITLVDATKKVFDAAKDAHGLPKEFRVAAGRLPIIQTILQSARNHLEHGNLSVEDCQGIEPVVIACETKVKKLNELFRKVLPGDNASITERYYQAVKTLGKGSKVESLMKGILEDVQLLAHEHGLRGATASQATQVAQALDEVVAMLPGMVVSELVSTDNIPFRRDPGFIARQGLLDQLFEKLSPPAARVALVGLGGVGKSQLAIEYAYRLKEWSTDSWLFWIHAGNRGRFEQSFMEIADVVGIPDRQNPRADILRLVHDWLRDARNGKWLIILDNADHLASLDTVVATSEQSADPPQGTSGKPLWHYIPQSQHGKMIVTTRSEDQACKLVDEHDIITIGPMDEAAAVALYEKRLTSTHGRDQHDSTQLVAALEYMPLAIVQAAAYINQMLSRCSTKQYLEKFDRSDKSKASLLSHEAGQLRRNFDAKNSILLTWHISFDQIRQERPSAADLLSLMSFFDRNGIPEYLLRSGHRRDNTNGHTKLEDDANDASDTDTIDSSVDDTEEFERDLAVLRKYSFVTISVEGAFQMHRLVQLATQMWLKRQQQLEHWKDIFIENLDHAFPIEHYGDWNKCQDLFPHVQASLPQRPVRDASLILWTRLLCRAARYALEKTNVESAMKMSQASLTAQEKLFSHDHFVTSMSRGYLAKAYKLSGNLEKCEELEREVVEAAKREMGPAHHQTLSAMSNLAATIGSRGRWEEAEELETEVVELKSKSLGPENESTLISMHNLASTYHDLGHYEKAEKLAAQVIDVGTKIRGQEHPDTLSAMGLLGLIYIDRDRLEEAEELLSRVVKVRTKVLGPQHLDTIGGKINLAQALSGLGRIEEAEELEVEAVDLHTQLLGPDHPDRLMSMLNLGGTLRNQGRYEEAEKLHSSAFEIGRRAQGEDHPQTLLAMHNLAVTWRQQERYTESMELMTLCLEHSKRRLGEDHPDTIGRQKSLLICEAAIARQN